MTENNHIGDIAKLLDIPEEYYYISVPKSLISKEIKKGLEKKDLSLRKLGDEIGLKHPQIVRVTQANNYNIDTLLKILNGLDLEIEIKEKEKDNSLKDKVYADQL